MPGGQRAVSCPFQTQRLSGSSSRIRGDHRWPQSEAVASRAGVRAYPAYQVGLWDIAAADAVDVAIARGLPIATAQPDPLRAIDLDGEIEELPGP
jgi:hypothetical protein